MDYMTWLTHYEVWRIDRDGKRWTLALWAKRPGQEMATKREFVVDGEDDAGVAFARLVRLAIQAEETR